MDLGDLEDAEGNTLLLPLFAGENILRLQNVSGRHNPAYTYPTDMRDTHNRDWDFYWSNVHIGSIRLTRAGDLPAFGTITGNVLADRPAGLGVRRALVTANPPGDAPPEPSAFWKNGWYTCTADDGSFTLNAPAGAQDLKAGRPGSYQVQGSPIATVDVPVDGSVSTDLTLSSLFHDDGQGRQVAEIQNVYFDQAAGNVGILPVDGENGYKVGWIDPADSTTIYVDVPRTGLYKVASSYFNGGTDGTVRISTDRGSSTQALQPVTGWDRQGLVNYPDPLYLVHGTNAVTMTLVSGSSDQNAFHLTMPPVTVGDAAGALRIAAGLSPAADADLWTGTITGGPQITLEDAARLLLAATGHPL
jgi:hypothetical protein